MDRLIQLKAVQLINAAHFGSAVMLSRELIEVDYELGYDLDSGNVVARHRVTNLTRLIPVTNVISMEPAEPARRNTVPALAQAPAAPTTKPAKKMRIINAK